MHLLRFVIMGHEKLEKCLMMHVPNKNRKREARAMKDYSNAKDVIEVNKCILEFLKETKSRTKSHSNDQEFTIDSCTIADFDLLLKSQLRAFIIVRGNPDIYEGLAMDIPTVKGSLKAILEAKLIVSSNGHTTDETSKSKRILLFYPCYHQLITTEILFQHQLPSIWIQPP
jgi:hypothetical protein